MMGDQDGERAATLAAQKLKDSPTEAIEVAWGLIANAGGGDWSKESPEWQEAAARWRDRYMVFVTPVFGPEPGTAAAKLLERTLPESHLSLSPPMATDHKPGCPWAGPFVSTAEGAQGPSSNTPCTCGPMHFAERAEAARVAKRESDRQDPIAVRHWLRNGPRGGLQAVRIDFERWRDRMAWRYCRRLIRDTVRAVINRGYERSFMTSRTYHEMHALIDRVFPSGELAKGNSPATSLIDGPDVAEEAAKRLCVL